MVCDGMSCSKLLWHFRKLLGFKMSYIDATCFTLISMDYYMYKALDTISHCLLI